MNIDSIVFDRYGAVDGGRPGRSPRNAADVDDVRKKAEPQAHDMEPPVTDGTAPAEEEEAQEARGVLRLLQEGHFKGVADLRLRINFAEELAGSELPELSAPTGNGKAYQKFLAIYQGLQGTDGAESPEDPAPVETPENPAPVDVVA